MKMTKKIAEILNVYGSTYVCESKDTHRVEILIDENYNELGFIILIGKGEVFTTCEYKALKIAAKRNKVKERLNKRFYELRKIATVKIDGVILKIERIAYAFNRVLKKLGFRFFGGIWQYDPLQSIKTFTANLF